MGKRERGMSVNLDSFLDLMTCMLGVLILMILLTGIDASQIKVLVPTPMEQPTDKRPIFIECRNNELFLVPIEDITRMVYDEMGALAEKAKGDQAAFAQLLETATVKTESHEVDLAFALMSQFALTSLPGVSGYKLESVARETAQDWFGKILNGIKKDEEMITFLVRDDSFIVFKKARALAWLQNIQVSCELLDVTEPIKFGLGGQRSMAQ
ncbi:MAG TPA: hypothetical protein P5567_14940 [Kiritimatiellia bacterium]|nr:hypothetical protein [Kiritimatiellia bacterium]HSA19355.1 hypothetical protein [Kiritimatiellia bacterium]